MDAIAVMRLPTPTLWRLCAVAIVLALSSTPTAADDVNHCSWTAPDGSMFDLSALSRSPQTEANKGDWYQHAAAGSVYEYHLNVCANTHKVPPVCVKEAELTPAVAYQSKNVGHPECFPLGQVRGCSWELIDATNPEKGVVVTYKGGARTPCSHDRQISYHFLCTHGSAAFEQGPYEVVEAPPCMYNVYWPTHHGCPLNSHVHGGKMGRFLRNLAYLFGAYLVGGTLFNVVVRKKRFGTLEAVPHGFFWGALVYTAVQAARECFPAKEVVDGSSNVGGVGGDPDEHDRFGGGGGGGGFTKSAPLDGFDEKFPMSQPAPAMSDF